MRHLPSLTLIILAAFLISGCATSTFNYYTGTVEGWRGGNVNTLVRQWGTPDNKTISRDGQTYYYYKTTSYRNTSQPTAPEVGVHYTPGSSPVIITNAPNTNMTWNRGTMSMTCVAIFVANKKGVITDTKIQGRGCYGGESFASQKSNPQVKTKNQF
jgi:hypothetical protein